MSKNKKQLAPAQREKLFKTLQARFEKNMARHRGLEWRKVKTRLEAHPEKLWSLDKMEETRGEPDVIGQDKETGEYIFVDCSAQTPEGRVSLCYDDAALEARKEHKPKGSAVGMAEEMGVELLTEEEYFELQKLGDFDTKRSSWIKTPPEIRKLGGALYCDRRYGRVSSVTTAQILTTAAGHSVVRSGFERSRSERIVSLQHVTVRKEQ